MLVCHCHRVNDKVIREACASGAQSVADVGDACGAGTGCGGCKPAIEGVITSVRASEGVASLPMIMAPEPDI